MKYAFIFSVAIAGFLLLGFGCSKNTNTETATDTEVADTATGQEAVRTSSGSAADSPCGDGTCDAAEQADATLCPSDCIDGATTSETGATGSAGETAAVATATFEFVPDSGIRVEDASNAAARMDAGGTVSLMFQNRSSGARGRNDLATASASSDWLDFTVTDTGVNPAEFRALRLPDGTCRAYGLDATISGVLPGSSGLKSKSSADCITFTEDEGVRYELTESDDGSMGVYDLFVNSAGGVVLLYLGDLMGANNLRRAYSTDNGWTFTFQDDDVLGDLAAGGGARSYVDNKVLVLSDGRILMVAMKSGKIYTFVSSDDGVSWTIQPDALTSEEFAGQGVTGLYDPQIIQLSDGRYRIYVTGQVGGGKTTSGADAVQNLYSATTEAE